MTLVEKNISATSSPPLNHKRDRQASSFVVEFIGPTGAGKTTVCNQVAMIMEREGVTVARFKDVKRYFYRTPFSIVRLILKTFLSEATTMLRFYRLLWRHGHLRFDAISRFARLCTFHTAQQEFCSRQRPHVLLLDQWSVQGLWSAVIIGPNTESLIKELGPYFFPVDAQLYCEIDLDTSLERIGERKHGLSRFDSMAAHERRKTLEQNNGYLYNLFRDSNCDNKAVISMHQTPAETANEVVKFITDRWLPLTRG